MNQQSEKDAAAQERRRHSRQSVHWTANLHAADDPNECTVLDISPGGAQVQTSDPLPAKTGIVLKLDQGDEYPGDIVWQQGSFMGIRFRTSGPTNLAA